MADFSSISYMSDNYSEIKLPSPLCHWTWIDVRIHAQICFSSLLTSFAWMSALAIFSSVYRTTYKRTCVVFCVRQRRKFYHRFRKKAITFKQLPYLNTQTYGLFCSLIKKERRRPKKKRAGTRSICFFFTWPNSLIEINWQTANSHPARTTVFLVYSLQKAKANDKSVTLRLAALAFIIMPKNFLEQGCKKHLVRGQQPEEGFNSAIHSH